MVGIGTGNLDSDREGFNEALAGDPTEVIFGAGEGGNQGVRLHGEGLGLLATILLSEALVCLP